MAIAKVVRTFEIDGKPVEFVGIPIKRGGTVVGFGNMPVPPKDADEDACALWLNDMVERKVFTYKQIVNDGLYNIYLSMSAKVGTEYMNANESEPPKKLSLSDMTAAMAFREEAIETCGPKANNPELVADTMVRLWWQSKRTDTGEWDATKHDLFPKDVR